MTNFNIYELLYVVQHTNDVVGVILIIIGMMGFVVSFIGAMVSNSKKAMVFGILGIVFLFLSVLGYNLNFEAKVEKVNEYIKQHNLNKCEVLKELVVFDKDDWLDIYYNECIKSNNRR